MDPIDDIAPNPKRPKTQENDDKTGPISSGPSRGNDAAIDGWAREIEAGVRAYVTSKKHQFNCGFKQRYSDFLVNEIGLDGIEARLTSITAPKIEMPSEPKSNSSDGTQQVLQDSEIVQAKSALEAHMALENGTVESDSIEAVMKMFVTASALQLDLSESGKLQFAKFCKENEVILPFGNKSKQWRGEFHSLIRNHFPVLRSETCQRDQQNIMKIWCGKDKYDVRRAKQQAPAKFVKMILYKENKDTSEAMSVLAKLSGIHVGKIGFGGTKDKRGITTQFITVPYTDPQRLANLNSRLFALKLGNFSLVNNDLGLGDLQGNRFRIVLRNAIPINPETNTPVQPAESKELATQLLKQACEELKKFGFINYYGMQRFGTGTIRTHHVGKECLKGNWKEVIRLILAPRPGERQDIADARMLYSETKDIPKMLKALPKMMVLERTVLQALQKSPTDFKGAFLSITRTMRLMYAHAYQSFIWNSAASQRIEEFGYRVVVGDLVAVNLEDLVKVEALSNVGDDNINPASSERGEMPELRANSGMRSAQVHVVTADDVDKYSIEQVVLPLVGSNVTLPQNLIGDYINQLLKADGLTSNFENDKEFRLEGAYRQIITRPIDFDYSIFSYEADTADYMLTDYDLIQAEQGKIKEIKYDENGSKLGVRLNFILKSSSYASCLVRELAKQPFDQAFLREALSKPRQVEELSPPAVGDMEVDKS